MRKRIISMILVISMVFALLPTYVGAVDSSPFKDVNESDWFYNEVLYAYEQGLMKGIENDVFGPNETTTRAMVVTILYRLEGSPAVDTACTFRDVKAGEYYEAPVIWAAANNIVNGYDPKTFAPKDFITREQLATILYRYASYKGYDVSAAADLSAYEDADQIDDYAQAAMEWANAAELITGITSTILRPLGNATRAQVAAVFMRFCEIFVESSDPSIIYTVTFDSNGGSAVESQQVKKGECATEPVSDYPVRSGFMFMGWHMEKLNISNFDFENTAIYSDLILYAHWVDMTDKTDTDGDGLLDSLEDYFGTDKQKIDTDGEGLSDYFELNTLNTNPSKKDSDDNGITDDLEDNDSDGLNNADEFAYGTDATYYDTDFDYLSDFDEIKIYGTNPLNADTDGDGANDGDEIAIGSDPLVAENSFITEKDFGTPTEDCPVSVSVIADTDGDGADSLTIEPIIRSDDCMISDFIAGYLGYAYNLTTEGKLNKAKIVFKYDTSLGTIGEDFQPRIYYLDEASGELEELQNQTVVEGQVSAEVSHFSTYILLNKIEFDEVWKKEIRLPEGGETHNYTGIDVVFVIDSSGSMSSNDNKNLRKTAAKNFIEKLGEDDRGAVIDFDSGASVKQKFTDNHQSLNTAVDSIDASGGTSLSAGIGTAISLFTSASYTRTDAYKYIIFLTDGDGTYSTSYTTSAADNDIMIYTIGLGSGVKESTLKAIATGTGGKYYFATTASNLPDIYSEVSFETIDYTTDSNNDGISDYYTKLINDGDLVLTNSSCLLVGCTDIFGEDSNDWDGDGLLNGEEIEIIISKNGKPAIKMHSHPFFVDYDNDGYDDKTEIEAMGTDPLSYTVPYGRWFDILSGNSYDGYYATHISEIYEDDWFIVGVTHAFDHDKTTEAEKILIDYFYDFASQESIDANKEAIEARLKTESIIEGIGHITKIATNIKSITDSTTGISELDRKQEKVKNFGYNVFKGLKSIFKSTNEKDLDTAIELISSSIKSIDNSIDLVEDFQNEAEGVLEAGENVTSQVSRIASVAKTICTFYYKDGKLGNIPIPKSFTKFSQKYSKWMNKEAFDSVTRSDLVGFSFDIINDAAATAELYSTFSKLQANTEAYMEYLDCIEYISQNGNNVSFVKKAAGTTMKIVLNDGHFMQELALVFGEKVAVTTFTAIIDKVLEKYPYTAVIKVAVDLGIHLSGIDKLSSGIVEALMADAIIDSFVSAIQTRSSIRNIYIDLTGDDFDLNALRQYMTQLCQSRIYGEDVAKHFFGVKSLSVSIADWITPLTGKMTSDEMLEAIDDNMKNLYSIANYMNLILSPELPKPSGSGNGGGAW